MGRELILLTGATGFVGFRVLVRALECGYAVRCVVQDPADLRKILSAPSIKALRVNDHQLFWTLIFDMTAPGAFNEAVRGAKYIVHCAGAPSNSANAGLAGQADDDARDHMATLSSVGLFQSAARVKPNVLQRIIITTSVADIEPKDHHMAGFAPQYADPPDSDYGLPAPAPPAPPRAGTKPHSASKASTLRVSKEWVIRQKPSFDVVFLLPGWVLGGDELAASLADLELGSNGPLIRLLKGDGSQPPLKGGFVSVHDVADAHVSALDSSVLGNGVVILSAKMVGPDVLGLVRQQFPEAFQTGVFRADTRQFAMKPLADVDEEMNGMGIKYRSFGETVIEVAGQYLVLEQSAQDEM